MLAGNAPSIIIVTAGVRGQDFDAPRLKTVVDAGFDDPLDISVDGRGIPQRSLDRNDRRWISTVGQCLVDRQLERVIGLVELEYDRLVRQDLRGRIDIEMGVRRGLPVCDEVRCPLSAELERKA